MNLHVRTLTPEDQPSWRSLRLHALDTYPSAFLTTAAEQRARSADQDRAGLARGNWRGLFLSEDRLIGLAALIPMQHAEAKHRMEVGAIYVHPSYHGTPAAQTLLTRLKSEAKDKGALQLELLVEASNTRAIQFYERNGFVQYGRQPRAAITDHGTYDDCFFVCFLDDHAQ